MAAVIGFLVVASLAVAGVWLVAGPRHHARRDPTFDLEAVSGRLAGTLSALAGIAVAALVFLVTQAASVPDPSGIDFTTVLVMFVVAFIGYFSSSLLYANVSHRAEEPGFDLGAAQYAGASISLFSVLIGWFALKPLFETFGLNAAADITGWFLVGTVVVAYGLLASALYRSGYATLRTTLALPAFAVAGVLGWLVVVAIAPAIRSADSTLALTIMAFVAGVPAYLAMTLLPIAARDPSWAPVLAERWHLAVLAYAQAVIVLIGFLLLAVWDLT